VPKLKHQENATEELRETFNRWAEEGRGEGMEAHHLPIVEPMLALIDFAPSDAVLDVGCGTGWLVRRLARRLPAGRVTGIDVSDEMIRRARLASSELSNVHFETGTAEVIPAAAESFNKILSVESAYYWPDPAQGLGECFRVLRAGGSAWILINYYRDNPHCHRWGPLFGIPSHLLSSTEWAELFTAAGFAEVTHRCIPDTSATRVAPTGPWFRDVDELQRFKAVGALLVSGVKPVRK